MSSYNASWLGTEVIPLQTKPQCGVLFFVLLIRSQFFTLCFGTLWHFLIKNANQFLAGRSISDSILLPTLSRYLPYFSLCHWYLGTGKEEIGCCINCCLWTGQLLLGTDDFGHEPYFRRKVKAKGMFIVLRGSKNHACSLMTGFLWEGNSKLMLFSFASLSLRGSW